MAEATSAVEEAIRLSPKEASYYDNLAAMQPFSASDNYLTALEGMAAEAASLSAVNRMHLHFALAKANEHLGDPDDAFRQLLAANALKRQQVGYDEAATIAQMDPHPRTVHAHVHEGARRRGGPVATSDIHHRNAPFGHDTDRADIGKPSRNIRVRRTHPVRADSRRHRPRDAESAAVSGVGAGPCRPTSFTIWERAILRSCCPERRAQDELSTRCRQTFSMPDSSIWRRLTPIIHAIRDPLDTCVSCFSVHFTKGQLHTYDLAEFGRYYRHYQELMAHWRNVLPAGRILDVLYEELVDDLEGVARRIVARCGLPWDPRCLDFHRNTRPIRTASATQVRRPNIGVQLDVGADTGISLAHCSLRWPRGGCVHAA